MEVLLHKTHSQDLLVYLYKLYQGQSLCDINIESRDGVIFWTHKLVLSASSTFIHQILLANPGLNSLKLDIHSEVLLLLLEYGYTGQLFVSNHLQYDVHGAATYLQMYTVLDLLKKLPEADNSTIQQIADKPHDVPSFAEGDTLHPEVNDLRDDMSKKTVTNIKQDEINKDVMIEMINDVEGSGLDVEEQSPNLDVFKEESAVTNTERCEILENTEPVVSKSDRKSRERRSTRKRKHEKLNYSLLGDVDYDIYEIGNDKGKKKAKVKNGKEQVDVSKSGKGSSKNCLKVLRSVKFSEEESYGKDRKKGLKHDLYTKIKDKVKRNRMNNRKKSKSDSTRCQYCFKRLPFGLKRLKHLLKKHKDKYLGQLFSSFLLKCCKSLKCRMGTMYSFSETGSRKMFSCNICGKKLTRYSLLDLHLKNDHCLNKNITWFKFLSTKCKRFYRESELSKSKVTKKRRKSSKRKAMNHSKKDKKTQMKIQLKSPKMKLERDSKVVLKQERLGTVQKNAFRCCICSKGLLSEITLQKHLERIHSLSTADAKQHLHLLPEALKCEVTTCQFSSTNLLEVRDHTLTVHPFINHRCEICKAMFKVPLLLERHVLSKHHGVGLQGRPRIGDRTFMCGVCGRSFPRGASLRRHEYFTHGIKSHGVKVYKCDYEGCNYETAASSSLKLHASKHITEKRFTCEYCGMKLKTDISHKKHVMKMHLGVRPFLCQVCGMSFGEDHELKSHMNNRHNTAREYKCQYCDYASNVKYTFFTHLFNVHNVRDKEDKRKEYKCHICNYKSILHHKFKIHMNGHTDTRSYWCNICNKSFVCSSTLHSHKQWVHSDKYLSCTQCDYQTKTKQKLNEHVRVQHQLRGYKPYRCPYCDFRCATGGNTRKHIKQVHRGYEIHYYRDDGMLQAARVARANGQHNTLAFIKGPIEGQSRNSALCSSEENQGHLSNSEIHIQSDLTSNIRHIPLSQC